MNYKEESISLDKNTVKQLYAFFLTFYSDTRLAVPFILSIPTAGLQLHKYECNSNVL